VVAGRVSDLVWCQPDVFPTIAELTEAVPPKDLDGISILPEILGAKVVGRNQEQHEFLYWEFNNQTAVRMGNWKAIEFKKKDGWELYDLSTDISESNNVASDHPDVLTKMKTIARKSHEPERRGTYADRSLHEKDRRAKWGTAKQPPKRKKVE
jgi:arylsulfatase A-like enzyme